MPNPNAGMPVGKLFKHVSNQKWYRMVADNPQRQQVLMEVVKSDEGDEGRTVPVRYQSFASSYARLTDEELRQAAEMGLVEGEAEGEAKIGFLVTPDERHDFDRIILADAVKKSIDVGLAKIGKQDLLNEVWGLKRIDPLTGKCAMNFYGAPGTGKTLSALAVAKKLNKKMLQVDYASMISKWVGDTAKHITQVFKEATEADAVLFFDEADSMLSKRLNFEQDSTATSINQNRNVLMQELDKFNGVVIFATNLFKNYDEALLRRIAQHVEFELPTKDMRKNLMLTIMPPEALAKCEPTVDWDDLAEATNTFSGGDLKNVIINAITAAALGEGEFLTQAMLLEEISKIRKAKEAHGKKTIKKGVLGFSRPTEEEDPLAAERGGSSTTA